MDIKDLDKALGLDGKKRIKRKTIKCEQCGSSDVDIVSDDIAKCKHCGAKQKLNKIVVNNFTSTDFKETKTKGNSSVYIFDKKITDDEFLRKSFLALSLEKNTPENILDSNFDSPQSGLCQFLVQTIHYTGFYSATLGFDRIEPYENYVEKWDATLKCNIRERVIKERTVTDWKPTNGSINSIKTVAIKLGNNDDALSYILEKDIDYIKGQDRVKGINKNTKLDVEILSPTPKEIEKIKEDGEDYVRDEISFNADKVKDKRFSINGKVVESKIYLIPFHVLQYSYGNEKYFLEALDYSNKIVETFGNVQNDIQKTVEKKCLFFSITTLVASIMLILGSLLSFAFLANSHYSSLLVILFIIIFILNVILYITYGIYRNKIENSTFQTIKQVKKDKLIKKLQQMNLSPLMEEELKFFETTKESI